MFCTECGAVLPDGMGTCPNCGAFVGYNAVAKKPEEDVQPAVAEEVAEDAAVETVPVEVVAAEDAPAKASEAVVISVEAEEVSESAVDDIPAAQPASVPVAPPQPAPTEAVPVAQPVPEPPVAQPAPAPDWAYAQPAPSPVSGSANPTAAPSNPTVGASSAGYSASAGYAPNGAEASAFASDGYSAPAGATPGKGLGIASLICGIASVFISWIPFVNFVGLVLGSVSVGCGIAGMKKMPKGVSGRGIAIAGLICGVCGVSLCVMVDCCVACLMIVA